MNWGKSIALFYTLFAATMVIVVIRSTQYDNSLVSEKYYQDDIAYQQQYNRIKNSQELKVPLNIHYEKGDEKLIIDFPPSIQFIKGTIHLFCPSDSEADLKLPIELETVLNRQTISVRNLKKGLWKVKVQWESPEMAYYDEKTLIR